MQKLPQIEVGSSFSQSTGAEVVVVFQDPTRKPFLAKSVVASSGFGKTAGDWIQRLHKKGVFDGKAHSAQWIRYSEGFHGEAGTGSKAEGLFLLGAGPFQKITEEKMRSLGGFFWARLKTEHISSIALHGESFDNRNWARAFLEGILLRAYRFDKYKSKKDAAKEPEGSKRKGSKRVGTQVTSEDLGLQKISFITDEKEDWTDFDSVVASAEAIGIARDWSNEPSNFGTPVYYANEARKLAQSWGLKCRVLTEADARREKMGLYLGVGQGAEREGRIVIVEYTPKPTRSGKSGRKPGKGSRSEMNKDFKTIALVGKGITFDTGGISIKPSARMEEMKHDMTGAATVMGAVCLASRWRVPNRVVGILAFAENMPDGDAIQPGNVLMGRNGKTVEVNNTDAEGRLILADVLDYAQDLEPDAVIDVATLTGAVGIALGKLCCAILGNDDALIEQVRRCGEIHGEKIWPLPLYDEYFEDMKSDVADMKNVGNDGHGGTIRGAIFLKQFIRKDTRWVHLDIASTAYNISHLSYIPHKGASGLYVRTLAQFAAEF